MRSPLREESQPVERFFFFCASLVAYDLGALFVFSRPPRLGEKNMTIFRFVGSFFVDICCCSRISTIVVIKQVWYVESHLDQYVRFEPIPSKVKIRLPPVKNKTKKALKSQ